MTEAEIESKFYKILNIKAVYKDIEGISEDKIYNWRKGRGAKPSIGDMINLLYKLNYIEITSSKTEPKKGSIDFAKKGINLITGYLI